MLSVANLSRISKQDDVEARIAAKLATGKFTDTGLKYSPDAAKRDSDNPALRMTAVVDRGRLTWKR